MSPETLAPPVESHDPVLRALKPLAQEVIGNSREHHYVARLAGRPIEKYDFDDREVSEQEVLAMFERNPDKIDVDDVLTLLRNPQYQNFPVVDEKISARGITLPVVTELLAHRYLMAGDEGRAFEKLAEAPDSIPKVALLIGDLASHLEKTNQTKLLNSCVSEASEMIIRLGEAGRMERDEDFSFIGRLCVKSLAIRNAQVGQLDRSLYFMFDWFDQYVLIKPTAINALIERFGYPETLGQLLKKIGPLRQGSDRPLEHFTDNLAMADPNDQEAKQIKIELLTIAQIAKEQVTADLKQTATYWGAEAGFMVRGLLVNNETSQLSEFMKANIRDHPKLIRRMQMDVVRHFAASEQYDRALEQAEMSLQYDETLLKLVTMKIHTKAIVESRDIKRLEAYLPALESKDSQRFVARQILDGFVQTQDPVYLAMLRMFYPKAVRTVLDDYLLHNKPTHSPYSSIPCQVVHEFGGDLDETDICAII